MAKFASRIRIRLSRRDHALYIAPNWPQRWVTEGSGGMRAGDEENRGAGGVKALATVAALVWGAVGALTFIAAVAIAYIGALGAPFWDQWAYVDPGEYLRHPWQLHNGQHPMQVGRLLFAADYYLFGARTWFLNGVTFASLTAEVLAFVMLARLGGMRGFRETLVVAGFAATMIFNPQLGGNLWGAFQVTFVMNFAASVGAVYALTSYAVMPRAWKLALSLVCSVIAVCTLANGVVIPALLIPMAIYLRLPRRAVLLQVGVFLLALVVLFGPDAERGPSYYFSYFAPVFVLIYLGGGLGRAPASLWPDVVAFEPLQLSLWLGVALAVCSVCVAALLAKRGSREPVMTALVVLMIFVVLTAYLTAMGRAMFGNEVAIADRYASGGAVLIVALGLAAALLNRGWKIARPLGQSILVATAGLGLLIPASGISVAQNTAIHQRAYAHGQTALVVGAHDGPVAGLAGFGDTTLAWTGSASLRAAQKWHYYDPWSHAIGDRRDFSDRPACGGGEMQIVDQQTAAQGYVRLTGWVDRVSASRGRIVVVARPDGVIVGYGLVHKHLSDLTGGLLRSPGRREWVGHARIELQQAGQPLVAYLASSRVPKCRIGEVAPR